MFTIVIPAFNEGSRIAVTIFDIQKVLTINKIEGAEIIVVDDGSTDRTAEMSSKTGNLLLSHPHNIGYGRSLKDGIEMATNDTIIITNADGSYPPEMIPVILNEYNKGFDMIIGARKESRLTGTFKKRLLRTVIKKITEFSTGREIVDIDSGFRIFSKKDIISVFIRLGNDISFASSLTLSYIMEGKFIKYIPVDYKSNNDKESFKIKIRFFNTLLFIIGEVLFYDPMKIFILYCGSLLAFTGLCFITALLTKWLLFSYLGLGCIFISILFFGYGLFSVQLNNLFSKKENDRKNLSG